MPRAHHRSAPANMAPQWISYHTFYHAEGDDLLLRLILPVLHELRPWVSRFFFIRYQLGGPHVRLRLLCDPRSRRDVDQVLRDRTAGFFRRYPAASSLDESAIREHNRRILATEPEEIDAVYANHSIVELPFRPETERYGGQALLDHSLRFFSISSAYALHFAELHQSAGKQRVLAGAMRALLRQALGFADEGEALSSLLAYATPANAVNRPALLDYAEQAFHRRSEAYLQIVREEIDNLGSHSLCLEDYLLTAASRRLRRCIQDASDLRRWRIARSQMHMTANRLGLGSMDEIYLGLILRRTVLEIVHSCPSLLKRVRDTLKEFDQACSGNGLQDLERSSVDELLAHNSSLATGSAYAG